MSSWSRSLRSFALALVALAASAHVASAATLSVTGTIPGLGSANTIKYTLDRPSPLPDVTNNVYVVGFQGTLDGVAGTSFCVDVVNSLAVPGTFNATIEALSAPYMEAAQIAHRWANNIGEMASSLGISIADAASGVQLAIWSNVFDQPATLGAISFARARSAGEELAFTRANDSSFWNGTDGTVLLRLTDATGAVRQGQIFTPSVPEPTGFAAFALGALVVVTKLRRPTRG